MTHHAKNLYNQALYAIRQHREATGKYLPYVKVDVLMKQTLNLEGACNYGFLKAGVSQQILRKLDKNYRSFFASHKDFAKNPHKYTGKPKPPQYVRENHANLIFDYQRFSIKREADGSETAILDKKTALGIPIPSALVGKRIVQIELIPRFSYFEACFAYRDVEVKVQVPESERTMAIDCGLNNLATCVTNGVIKPFVISGKPIKSVNQHYNKVAAAKKSTLKKRHDKDWSAALDRLTYRRQTRIGDYLHKASRAIVNRCLEHQISTVVIGNVANSTRNINLGKRTNQNFVGLSLGQFVGKLTYKLEAHGITVIVREESYTSRASFIDDDPMPKAYTPKSEAVFSGTRIRRGLYKSKNGRLINADVNGAYNILRKETVKDSYAALAEQTLDTVAGWLHPCTLAI